MTLTFVITDDLYSANGSDGRKRVYGAFTPASPYTANGEVLSTGTYFKSVMDGVKVIGVHPSATVAKAGIVSSGIFRGNNSSYSAGVLQFVNISTTAVMGWVDNTVSDLSGATFYVEMIGR